ncbi:MAG: outer membrane lipoprotein carrier protein LolA [Desulfobacteraceae bacterium]|nr:outer membrane lipoprotein carrier protein LolA [Desulfobacteraceae bacterium]
MGWLYPGVHPAEAGQRSLGAILASYAKSKKALQSLKAGFTQTKILSVFKDKEEGQGILLYKKPLRAIWQFTAPGQSKTVVNNRDAWAVFPAIRQIQKLHTDTSNTRMLMSLIGFDGGEVELSRLFDISLQETQQQLIGLRLVPIDEKISPFFSEIELFLAPEDFLPRRIVMHETSKDLLIFEFHDLEKNILLEDSLFEFSVPEGFEVVTY